MKCSSSCLYAFDVRRPHVVQPRPGTAPMPRMCRDRLSFGVSPDSLPADRRPPPPQRAHSGATSERPAGGRPAVGKAEALRLQKEHIILESARYSRVMNLLRSPGLSADSGDQIHEDLQRLHPPEQEHNIDTMSHQVSHPSEMFNFITGPWLRKQIERSKRGQQQ